MVPNRILRQVYAISAHLTGAAFERSTLAFQKKIANDTRAQNAANVAETLFKDGTPRWQFEVPENEADKWFTTCSIASEGGRAPFGRHGRQFAFTVHMRVPFLRSSNASSKISPPPDCVSQYKMC